MPAELQAGTSFAPANPLNPKRMVFCSIYARNPAGKAAAIAAGWSKNRAAIKACELLKEPAVIAEIERQRAAFLEELGVTRHSVLRTAAAIAHSNPLDFMEAMKTGDISKLTREQAAAIKKITIEEFEPEPEEVKTVAAGQEAPAKKKKEPKVKRRITLELLPKTPAVDLLGKHLDLWGGKDGDGGDGQTFINNQVNVTIRRVGA